MTRWLPLLLLLPLWLNGCAYLASFGSDLPGTIERAIAAGEYGKALDTLQWVKPDHPDYARLMRLKAKAQRLARELEKTTLREADRLEKRGEWYAAQQRYEQALEKLPDSDSLQKRYAAFLERRERYLRRLELALLMNRANWLIQNAPIRTEVARVLPEDYRRYPALRDYDKQLHKTARGLDRCLRQALDENRPKLLEGCLELRLKLDPEHRDATLIAEARAALARYHARERRRENDATRALIAELKQGYSHDNLLRARQLLDRLTDTPANDATSRRLRSELARHFRQGIEQGIAAGRERYSRGDVTGALEIWQALARIDPDNEKLEDHIARAERVLQKLERLGKEGAKVVPPNGSGERRGSRDE